MKMLSFGIAVEIIAFISALLWCGQKGNGQFRLFIPFMLFVVITESTARYLFYYAGVSNNAFVYVIAFPIYFIFYCYLLHSWIRGAKLKKIILLIAALNLGFNVVDATILEGFWNANFYSYCLQSVSLAGFCMIYLFDLLKNSEFITTPLKLPSFWIVTGLLFFNLGGVIMMALYDYARANQLSINGTRLFDIVFRTINVLLYGSFIIGFRLCYKSTTPSY
jgi:hypothetical protein